MKRERVERAKADRVILYTPIFEPTDHSIFNLQVHTDDPIVLEGALSAVLITYLYSVNQFVTIFTQM